LPARSEDGHGQNRSAAGFAIIKEVKMKKNKVIGTLLLVLAVATIAGMAINNATYWIVYDYITIILSLLIGISLLKQK
jgi:NO-binding membrane sensor protein with MHYT domain